MVEGAAGEAELAADRADVDDPAPALAAHRRQHELGQADGAEDVGLELAADELERDGLDGAGLAVAGVVDQHADRAGVVFDGRNRGSHRGFVGDV